MMLYSQLQPGSLCFQPHQMEQRREGSRASSSPACLGPVTRGAPARAHGEETKPKQSKLLPPALSHGFTRGSVQSQLAQDTWGPCSKKTRTLTKWLQETETRQDARCRDDLQKSSKRGKASMQHLLWKTCSQPTNQAATSARKCLRWQTSYGKSRVLPLAMEPPLPSTS